MTSVLQQFVKGGREVIRRAWLREKTITSRLHRALAVSGDGVSRERHNGDALRSLVSFEPSGHFPAVDLRQHEIEDDQIRKGLRSDSERPLTVSSEGNSEAGKLD